VTCERGRTVKRYGALLTDWRSVRCI
jgi:hypothetical protein